MSRLRVVLAVLLVACVVPAQAALIVEFQNTGLPLVSSTSLDAPPLSGWIGVIVKITPTAGESVAGWDFGAQPTWGIMVNGAGMSQRKNDPDSPDGTGTYTLATPIATNINSTSNAMNMDSHFITPAFTYAAGQALAETCTLNPANPMLDNPNNGYGYGTKLTGAIGYTGTIPSPGASVNIAYVAMPATATLHVVGQAGIPGGATTNLDAVYPVPEPSTIVLVLLAGMVGAMAWFRRK